MRGSSAHQASAFLKHDQSNAILKCIVRHSQGTWKVHTYELTTKDTEHLWVGEVFRAACRTRARCTERASEQGLKRGRTAPPGWAPVSVSVRSRFTRNPDRFSHTEALRKTGHPLPAPQGWPALFREPCCVRERLRGCSHCDRRLTSSSLLSWGLHWDPPSPAAKRHGGRLDVLTRTLLALV